MPDEFKKRTTRIRRRSIWEQTVVPVLSEDLQTKFDDMLDIGYEVATACEEVMQSPQDPVRARNLYVLRQKRNIAAYAFWIEVRDKYGNWIDYLGVRDGYEVVSVPPQYRHPGVPDEQDPEF